MSGVATPSADPPPRFAFPSLDLTPILSLSRPPCIGECTQGSPGGEKVSPPSKPPKQAQEVRATSLDPETLREANQSTLNKICILAVPSILKARALEAHVVGSRPGESKFICCGTVQSAGAAVTKYCRLGDLNTTSVLLTVLETGKSVINAPCRFSVW